MGELTDDPFQAARLILTLRREGVTDPRILSAIESVPRSAFIAEELVDLAYEDCVLPIDCGQTLERPSVLAGMLQALDLGDLEQGRVLIIGAGSGYVAALAAQLSHEVFAIERFRRLADQADRNLVKVGCGSVEVRQGDGLEGWPERGPFDRILLMGSVDKVPEALIAQLGDGGICLAPTIKEEKSRLICVADDGSENVIHASVIHAPLRAGVSKAL